MAFQLFGKLSLDGSGFQAGMAKAKSGAAKLKSSIAGSFKGLGAALAGAFAVSAITTQMRETIEFTTKVRDLANTFGMTTDHVQKLAYAAGQSGIELEVVMDAHKDLGKSMAEALAGVEGKIWAFKALGISVDEIKGKNIDEVFMRVAKAIHESGPILEPDQVKAIEDMMGGAGFQSLNMMRGDLQEIFATLEEMGGIIDEQAIKKIGELGDKMEAFKTRNRGLWADMMTFFGNAWMGFVNVLTASLDVFSERMVALFNVAKSLASLDFGDAAVDLSKALYGPDERSAKERAANLAGGLMAGGAGALGGGLNIFGDIDRKIAEKQAAEKKLLEAQKKAKELRAAGEAQVAEAMEADEARKKVQEELAELAEKEDKRRFDALSTAEQLLELETKLAAERLKLSRLPVAMSEEELALYADLEGSEQRAVQNEVKSLARKKQEETIALTSADVAKKKAETEKGAAQVTLAGEAKFGSMARIGGALGGRNPVLDMAKQQLIVQKENLQKVAETAQAVGIIAGTKG